MNSNAKCTSISFGSAKLFQVVRTTKSIIVVRSKLLLGDISVAKIAFGVEQKEEKKRFGSRLHFFFIQR